MKEELILMLSELRSQINDTIMRIEEESAAEGKEMVSTLMSCTFVNAFDLLKEETGDFLEYIENLGFIKTQRTNVHSVDNGLWTKYERVPIHDWIEFKVGKGWLCHPALIALYKNHTESC